MKTSGQKKTKSGVLERAAHREKKVCGAQAPNIRSPNKVMTLSMLGSSFPSRLSFMRILIRRLIKSRSKLKVLSRELDQAGYGSMVLSLSFDNKTYSLIGYTQPMNPAERTDRVIATKWDACFCLFNGVGTQMEIESISLTKEKLSVAFKDLLSTASLKILSSISLM